MSKIEIRKKIAKKLNITIKMFFVFCEELSHQKHNSDEMRILIKNLDLLLKELRTYRRTIKTFIIQKYIKRITQLKLRVGYIDDYYMDKYSDRSRRNSFPDLHQNIIKMVILDHFDPLSTTAELMKELCESEASINGEMPRIVCYSCRTLPRMSLILIGQSVLLTKNSKKNKMPKKDVEMVVVRTKEISLCEQPVRLECERTFQFFVLGIILAVVAVLAILITADLLDPHYVCA